MIPFNELQELWNQQPETGGKPQQPTDVIRLAEKNALAVKAKHRWTIGILSFTVLFLCWYFIALTGYVNPVFFTGALLMIFSLLLRVLLEYISFSKFQKIDVRADFKTYTEKLAAFYRLRKKIHFIATPLILLAYMGGFILLLPVFKQHFSSGFYYYIVISGIVLAIVFSWFIAKQIKKEMGLLHLLSRVSGEDGS